MCIWMNGWNEPLNDDYDYIMLRGFWNGANDGNHSRFRSFRSVPRFNVAKDHSHERKKKNQPCIYKINRLPFHVEMVFNLIHSIPSRKKIKIINGKKYGKAEIEIKLLSPSIWDSNYCCIFDSSLVAKKNNTGNNGRLEMSTGLLHSSNFPKNAQIIPNWNWILCWNKIIQ